MYQSYTDGAYPIWIDRSERVAWDVKSVRSGSRAAVERKTSGKNFKAAPGVSFYAVPRSIDGGPLPTKRDYLEAQAELNGRAQ
ncbi:hypothetical protein CN1A_42 [Clavibacter phage CN1A]|uniref:Uncharacterized protein n=1 Tax=Clavibacter phage CN1A TaxID=1406793 RepID=U5PTR9_9CAUD|nr:hypothetical protein CN1A_42 [Clavibacter phage CN1A]AGY47151.1 hypothetical protein CN1A_42 [Clavibacter phage CN1A]